LFNEDKSILKPVMFFIHGGAFYFGSGSSRFYGADYLVDQGVVLVTINYRLGAQGFLSLENAEVPGNAGLKDQVMALRWVRDNIQMFGGDPKKVTIFGQSAGGASVQYHILSPMSKGLFHRAISMSGSVLNPWSFRNSTREFAFRMGEKLGLKTEDPQELVRFLRQVNSMELTKTSHEVLTPEETPMNFGFPLLPTLDLESDAEVFLATHPKQLLQFGDLNDVPYINGVTSDEGLLAMNILNEVPDALKILDKEFERSIPLDFPVDRNSEEVKEIANKIKRFYFEDRPFVTYNGNVFVRILKMISDIWFFKDINAAIQKLSERYKSPIYFYKFSFSGPFGIIKRLLGAEKMQGVAHGDDLGYLFRMILTSRITLPPEDPSMVTLNRMVKMWTNFAKTGNPIPQEDNLLNVPWPPYTKDNHTYLNIDKELTKLLSSSPKWLIKCRIDVPVFVLRQSYDAGFKLAVIRYARSMSNREAGKRPKAGKYPELDLIQTEFYESIVVRTTDGLVRGKYQTSIRSNVTFAAFMGIPFARPPIGPLRFEPPQPVEPWSGVFNATEISPPCSQLLSFPSVFFIGQEDCLHINVYTPQIPTDELGKSLPVMVWIYGGGFVGGSSNGTVYGADYLIEEEVVVVSFNYRVGLLGFLSLQNEDVPGNNGLKDQVQALEWVQMNIRNFGGNPNRVTIFGQSSGGASVLYHTLSPLSKGLFQQGIAQSGSPLAPWAYQTQDSCVNLAFEMANRLGPETCDKREVLKRLRNATAEWLVDNIGAFTTGHEAFVGPTVDAVAGKGKTFLPDLPINLMNQGKFHNVPLIIGMTDKEGILMTYPLMSIELMLKYVIRNLQMALLFLIGDKLRDGYGLAIELYKEYFTNSEPLMLQYIDTLTDIYFGNSVYCSTKTYVQSSTAPVFSYEFEFNGTANVMKKIFGGDQFPGACHGDELPYLFTFERFGIKIIPGTPEYRTSARIIKLWTNFAKTGGLPQGK
ncbi:hypothetical protein L9F63_018191, partial [Diploptera punctata]